MWPALIRIHKLLQILRPLRIVYDDDKGGVFKTYTNKNQFKLRFIDYNISVIVIACLVGLVQVLSNTKDSNQPELTQEEIQIQTQWKVLGSVLFILYLTIFIYCLVAAWTFKYQTNSAIFILNQARGLYLDRQNHPGKISGAPSKKESATFGALLYIMMSTCMFAIMAVALFPIASNNNPGHVILTWILPAKTLQHWPYLFRIISGAYLGISAYYGDMLVMQAFTFVTALLFEMKYILRRGYNYDTSFKVKRSTNKFQREWIIYAENILFVREINQFGIRLYPGIMLTAFCINVATTTVCMKFHHELPAVMLYLLLGFDGVVAVATCIVQTFSVVAKEESESFIMYWKPCLLSKLARKQLKACLPTPIRLGPFFEMKRTTLLNTGNEVINMVVTLLLADK